MLYAYLTKARIYRVLTSVFCIMIRRPPRSSLFPSMMLISAKGPSQSFSICSESFATSLCFFFNDTATTEIYTLSLHDALPISREILEAVIKQIPPPKGQPEQPLRALVFDSHYDAYKGVIAYVRIVDGQLRENERVVMMATGSTTDILEVGYCQPRLISSGTLTTGEVGYIATGFKHVKDCRVGDTVTVPSALGHVEALPGYKPAKPMVFAGIYPVEGSDYPLLRDALDRLKLNDASLFYYPATSNALEFAFPFGFLVLLNMEMVQDRLEREYSLDILATAPSVEYY